MNHTAFGLNFLCWGDFTKRKMHLKGYKYGSNNPYDAYRSTVADWFNSGKFNFWTVLDQVAVLDFQLGSDLSDFLDHCNWTQKP